MKPFCSSLNLIRAALLLWVCSGTAAAQQPPAPAAAKPSVVQNGDFSRGSMRDNLWDGTDGSRNIKFLPREKMIFISGSEESRRSFPPSLSFEDLDGDGLRDLIAADPSGFFFFYKNLSKPGEPPVFRAGEMIPIYFTGGDDVVNSPKIQVVKWRSPLFDILFGDYLGRVVLVPNRGSSTGPQFSLPNGIDKFDLGSSKDRWEIPTRSKGQLWGNFFAPLAIDWNRDGKKDLLIGEGTYSANSIHIFINQGSDNEPKFSEDPKFYSILAYGYGREQLVPQAVDWDGDGTLDLIVGSRDGIGESKGTLSFYKGKAVPPGATRIPQLEFTSNIEVGGSLYTRPMAAPLITDFNGDGLPDLLIASPSDCLVKVALNTGTKTAPKLESLENIKVSEETGDGLKRYRFPYAWNTSTDMQNIGNYTPLNQFAVVETVQSTDSGQTSYDAEAKPSKDYCLKISYPLPETKTFQKPFIASEAARKDHEIAVWQTGINMSYNKNYNLSFKIKGNAMSFVVKFDSLWQVDETPNPNNPKTMDPVYDTPILITRSFGAGPAWQNQSVVVNVKEPNARKPKFKYDGRSVGFQVTIIAKGTGKIYIDDIQLVEQ
ncbi:MAG: VCBS repeat-containing protein [Verrucomicrobiae bacterium]|nr:VCBS repeat-containing protein [Verrucomicrobiae bacterium]